MELKTTEEFIREAHGAACSNWKQRIEKEFPDLFEKELEVGKWYKTAGGCLFFLTHFDGEKNKGYGFGKNGFWANHSESALFFGYKSNIVSEATPEEIESALIAEAKKRGYVGKEIVLIRGAIGSHSDVKMQENFSFEAFKNRVMCHCEIYGSFTIFQDGQWAEILPEQKTIITKGKALRIIAKKLKVSPESIEIQ